MKHIFTTHSSDMVVEQAVPGTQYDLVAVILRQRLTNRRITLEIARFLHYGG